MFNTRYIDVVQINKNLNLIKMHDIIDIFVLKVQLKETNILILFGGLAEKEGFEPSIRYKRIHP